MGCTLAVRRRRSTLPSPARPVLERTFQAGDLPSGAWCRHFNTMSAYFRPAQLLPAATLRRRPLVAAAVMIITAAFVTLAAG